MNIVKSNTHNKALTFLIASFIITMLIPFFGLWVWSAVSFLLIAYSLLNYPKTTFTKPFFYMMLFFIVALFYGFLGKGYGINNGLVLVFLAFFSGIVVCLNIKYMTKKQVSILMNVLVIVLLYKIVGTFFVLLLDSNAVRNWGYAVHLTNTTSAGLYQLYKYMGMYSYGEGEALAIVLPTFVAFFFNTQKGILRLIILILIIGGLVTQYLATLTTSFLLSVLFCAFVLVRHFFVGKRGFFNAVGFIVVIFLTFFILVRNTKNTFFENKMAEVEYSYNEGLAVGDVQKRSDLYEQSLKVIIHNPIFGLGVIPNEYGNYTPQTVSFHTAILDYWGLFGFFSLLLYLAWRGAVRSSYNLLNIRKKKLYKYAYFSLFFLLLLKGPVSIDVSFVFSTIFISIFMVFDYYRSSASDIVPISKFK